MKLCQLCDKPILPRPGTGGMYTPRRFCSIACVREHDRLNKEAREQEEEKDYRTAPCIECGRETRKHRKWESDPWFCWGCWFKWKDREQKKKREIKEARKVVRFLYKQIKEKSNVHY
jgi:hypothetical protein